MKSMLAVFRACGRWEDALFRSLLRMGSCPNTRNTINWQPLGFGPAFKMQSCSSRSALPSQWVSWGSAARIYPFLPNTCPLSWVAFASGLHVGLQRVGQVCIGVLCVHAYHSPINLSILNPILTCASQITPAVTKDHTCFIETQASSSAQTYTDSAPC